MKCLERKAAHGPNCFWSGASEASPLDIGAHSLISRNVDFPRNILFTSSAMNGRYVKVFRNFSPLDSRLRYINTQFGSFHTSNDLEITLKMLWIDDSLLSTMKRWFLSHIVCGNFASC